MKNLVIQALIMLVSWLIYWYKPFPISLSNFHSEIISQVIISIFLIGALACGIISNTKKEKEREYLVFISIKFLLIILNLALIAGSLFATWFYWSVNEGGLI